MRQLGLVFVFALISLTPAMSGAKTDKYAIVIGNNLGHSKARGLHFAEADAKKMHRVLGDLGGFPEANIHLLLGAKADEVKATLNQIEQIIATSKQKTDHNTLLVFYYSGHAEEGVLELGQTPLSFKYIRQFLEDSSADVRVAFLDSCESGRLIRKKGGNRSKGFEIKVADQISSSGYAIITSSAVDEMSQESEEIRGSVFTHFLVSALRGAGDASGDGRVTLEEAYHFVYGRTLARTARSMGGSQHPMYHFRLEGRGTIILTSTEGAGSIATIDPPATGRLIILDESNDIIVSESDVVLGQRTRVAMSPGHYRAYLLSENQSTVARFSLTPRGDKTLGSSDFNQVVLEETVSKGGLFLKKKPVLQHEITVGGMWRLYPLEGTDSTMGAALQYRLVTPKGLAPIVRLSWTAQTQTEPDGFNDISAYGGLGYLLQITRAWALHISVLGGGGMIWQDSLSGSKRYSSSFGYLGLGGIRFQKNHFVAGLEMAGGGRFFKMHADSRWHHNADAQATISLGFLIGRL